MQQSVTARDGSEYAAVLAREEFRNELESLFPSKSGKGNLEEVRFKMLRYHGNRCVFDVAMKSETGWHNVIAKLFAIDRQDAFDAMQRIHRGGFGTAAEFAIPKPIAYLPSLRVLLEEKVDGVQVKGILLADDESQQLKAVQRCGSWLARFHTTAPRFGNRVDPRALLDHVRGWADMVSQFGEPFNAKCRSLMKKLESAIPDEGSFEHLPGHGSYIPSHVLLNDRRTITIDFDEFELVDPARDIGWFLIALERFELKYRRPSGFYKRLAKPFLDSYQREANYDAIRHLGFYKGAEYLHRARHDLYKRIPPVREWAELMLDQAIAGL
jgi:aminoglycoside phosphotransferase (APT) family kinase protein